MSELSNKRIAVNTIYLYLRTIVVMVVSLYTSRLILKVLGVTDMGIYNIVGGIVILMTFLQTAQTKATSRFITFELGKNVDGKRQGHIFSICMTIHILIAILVLIVSETIGLFIVNEWTNIPPERMYAANIVYQFSVFTFVCNFIRVPYDAVIIAHEDMSVYAYMSVVEALLKLATVAVLIHIGYDHLIAFGGLQWGIAVILFVAYMLYVRYYRKEYKFRWLWEKKTSVQILSFSGWTLMSSFSNTSTQQGVSLLMNNFVGLVANAALGFAQQVNTALGQFVNSFTTAFNPQVIKLCAQEKKGQLHILMNRASKFSFILCYIIALPLIANMDFILRLWLTEVPQYTTEFCQLILVCTVIDATTGVFNTAITATGNIRNYQICISCSFLLDLLCAYLMLVKEFSPPLVFGSRIITRGLLNMLFGFYFSQKQLQFIVWQYINSVLLPILATVLISVPLVYLITEHTDGWAQIILTTLASGILIVLCLICFVFSKAERAQVIGIIHRKIHGRL